MFSKRVAFELKFQVRSKTYHGFYIFSSRSNIFHFPKKLSRNSSSFSSISLQRERERERDKNDDESRRRSRRQTDVCARSLSLSVSATHAVEGIRACVLTCDHSRYNVANWLAGWLADWLALLPLPISLAISARRSNETRSDRPRAKTF